MMLKAYQRGRRTRKEDRKTILAQGTDGVKLTMSRVRLQAGRTIDPNTGTAKLWSKLSGGKGGRKALKKFQVEQNKLINGRKQHGCLSWLCMGEEPEGASPTSHPPVLRSAGGTGQPPWPSHHHPAVPVLRARLRCNSKGWEGRPQDLLLHLTPCPLTPSTGASR